jgi:3-hydroxyisobutyrate dehydrogenase
MNISFLGTGLMGTQMAQRLLRSGFSLVVYNRTREKALPLEKMGARIAATPKNAVEETACSILMVTDAAAIRDLLFPGKAERPELRGRTIIQMGTISPEQSLGFEKEVDADGGDYLEAPVLGSTAEAEQGALLIMVGSTKEQFEKWSPLLKCLSAEPMRCGSVGSAAALKLALNQIIASELAGFSFSLGLVRRSHVPVGKFMEVLRKSSLYAPQYDKKLPRLEARDFSNPHFATKHLLKDVNLMIDAGRRVGLDTTAVEGIQRVISAALSRGLQDADYSSIYNAVDPKD